MMNLKEQWKGSRLLADGSFGTYYAEKYQTTELPETANTKYPERVKAIHEEYLAAGAQLIRTNTYASTQTVFENRDALKQNILAGCEAARQAVQQGKEKVYIAGSIGPEVMDQRTTQERIQEYADRGSWLQQGGVDSLVFETFSDVTEIIPAIRILKRQQDMPILVNLAVNQYGYTGAGLSAAKLLRELAQVEEIDGLGLNCGIGPGHMAALFHKLSLPEDKIWAALPNAGYPYRFQSRMQFSDNREYFAQKMGEIAGQGVEIIGGCCGTDPSYIKCLAEQQDVWKTECFFSAGKEIVRNCEEKKATPTLHDFYRNAEGVCKKKKLIAVELAPPLNADDEKIMEAAHYLQNHEVDVLTFPDSPSGRTRADAILMAEKVSKETGMCVMPHICCRDRNAIAIRSEFLGAQMNGIYNFLVITGDPVPAMARQAVKSVFQFDSVGMMRIIQDMNEESFDKAPLCYGGAINQNRRNLEVEISRVRKKIESGASFFLTQPVFTMEQAQRLRRIKRETGTRILCGIMPLVSRKNALFMKNEMSGIDIPQELIERYPENGTREDGEKVAVQIAREMMELVDDFTDGYYFSFPFNRVYLLEQIMKERTLRE